MYPHDGATNGRKAPGYSDGTLNQELNFSAVVDDSSQGFFCSRVHVIPLIEHCEKRRYRSLFL